MLAPIPRIAVDWRNRHIQGRQRADIMQVDLTDEISPADLENARRVAEALRRLLDGPDRQPEPLLLQAGDARVNVPFDRVRSVLKLIEGLTASVRPDPDGAEISSDEAAELLGIAPPSVARLIERKLLHARTVDGVTRLSRDEVLSFKARQAVLRRKGVAELAELTQEYDL